MPTTKELIGRAAKNAAYRAGYSLTRRVRQGAEPYGPVASRIYGKVQPFTMTPLTRIAALLEAVEYIERASVPGAIVECGVWRGGSMMAAAMRLNELGGQRALYLCDTFEGMTKPSEDDIDRFGDSKLAQWEADPDSVRVGAAVSLEDVQANMRRTGYDESMITYLKGQVEETLPGPIPDEIALLRLDTDWYESTKHELDVLWPRLSPRGVLIIDDYGYFAGARKAVDEFFESNPVLLTPVDEDARVVIKA